MNILAMKDHTATLTSARTYALEMHGHARYINRPFRAHLQDTVAVLKELGFENEWLDAAWLHLSLGNTLADPNYILHHFGRKVLAIAEVCNVVKGKKLADFNKLYKRVTMYPDSSVVCVASRVASVEILKPSDVDVEFYRTTRDAFDQHVASKVPYRLKQRLDKAIDLRLSLRGL